MSTSIFLDTETTGFPYTKHPLDHEKQPHIVQLGALLVDDDTREVLSTMSVIVKPDGWSIHPKAIDVHGITNELAHDVGIPENIVLLMFLYLQEGATRIAHNYAFDSKIIKIAVERFIDGDSLGWSRESDSFCTMQVLKNRGEPAGLSAAYNSIIGGGFENAHDALADARACMELYFAMKDKKLI